MEAEVEKEIAERRALARSKGWSKRVVEAVASSRVIIGMNSEMVLASWGEPENINKTLVASGETQQWVYGISTYVYFDRGVVSAVQTSE